MTILEQSRLDAIATTQHWATIGLIILGCIILITVGILASAAQKMEECEKCGKIFMPQESETVCPECREKGAER